MASYGYDLSIMPDLLPEEFAARSSLNTSKHPLVHYTTADTAEKILANKSFWLRNARLMNDFSEIEHGTQCIESALKSASAERLWKLVDQAQPGLSTQAQYCFENERKNLEDNTFMACFSEHHPSNEDEFGRLSMWRAYGGSNGLALVVRSDPFLGHGYMRGVFSGVVQYTSLQTFARRFERMVDGLMARSNPFTNVDRNSLLGSLVWMWRYHALCTKHPAFYEEKEWRVLYTPTPGSLNLLSNPVQVVRGVPQLIYQLPLSGADLMPTGFDIASLLTRVIVGPTEYPTVIASSLIVLMRQAGVENPEAKLHVSGIPLRAS